MYGVTTYEDPLCNEPLCRFIFFRTTTVQCDAVAWQTGMRYDRFWEGLV